MKKLFFAALLLLFAVGISGCSGNDDNNDFGPISGKWRIHQEIYTDGNGQLQTVNFPFNNPDCEESYLDFGADGALAFGTYNFECSVVTDDGSWSQEGNLVSVQLPQSVILVNDVWEVVQKSNTNMKVKVISADGVPSENEVYLTFIKD